MTRQSMTGHLPVIDPTSEDLQARRYLTIREAAQIMHLSPRSVYSYINSGKLPAIRIGSLTVVESRHAHAFEKRAVGRRRERVPHWHIPPHNNAQYLTVITVHLREGQEEAFTLKLRQIRHQQEHLFPGTAARYIVRSHEQPEQVQIILIWRQNSLPSYDEREAAFAALRDDLADLLDWESATFQEGQVFLTA